MSTSLRQSVVKSERVRFRASGLVGTVPAERLQSRLDALEVEHRQAMARAEERARAQGEKQAEDRLEKKMERERRKLENQLRAAEQAAAKALKALEEVVEARLETSERCLQGVLGEFGNTALQLAARVVRWVVDADPDVVGRVLADCLDRSGDSTIRARLHPQDEAHLREAGVTSLGERQLSLIPDAEVSRGGCVLEGESQILDGRIERQLDRLGEALIAAIAETGAFQGSAQPATDAEGPAAAEGCAAAEAAQEEGP